MLFASASEMARLLADREVSSRELTELLLARIDEVNPSLNAIVELRDHEALTVADALDREIAAGSKRPLLGVPVTVKEAFNVAGMKTTSGNPAFKDYSANSDATVVARLKRAGANIIGKTNVHSMLGDFAQTVNDLYGATRNPWDRGLTPGGWSMPSSAIPGYHSGHRLHR
jgi:amidase